MFKYHRVIAPSYGQHVKRSKTLVKCPWQYFYKTCLLLWSKLTWETSLLLIFELLQVFIETLTADHRYSLCYIWNLQVLHQMQLSKKLKTFPQFFFPFFLLAYLFSKLPTVKGTVTQMFKYRRVIAPFYRQHVKRSKTLVKCPWEYFYKTRLLLWSKLTWETSLLLIFELLRVFIETLTADHRYSLSYIWNLQVLHQMSLSKKLKTFPEFFFAFLKSSSNFEHFEKKDDIHSQCISEIIDCQIYG